jgi:hypothetical protein
MNEISENELLALNRTGLIPGPYEQLETYLKRIDYTLHLNDHLSNELKSLLSDTNFDAEKKELVNQSAENLKNIYDCYPNWTSLFFSNYKLPIWQGGCTWIFQMTEESPTSSLIQLRKTFINSTKYLGIYNRTELLTHELAHVGRTMFQEPKFEELLAYNTSKSRFRRWFGPLVQSSTESAMFLLLIFMLVIFDVFLITLNHPDAYALALWLKLIPVFITLAGLLRLWKKHQTYKLCIKNLTACVGSSKAEPVAYRLQDAEIIVFAKMNKKQINQFAAKKAKEELRWKIIFKAYFNKGQRDIRES